MAAITDLTTLAATAADDDWCVLHDLSAVTDKKISRKNLIGGTGTWTPGILFGGVAAGMTYSSRSGVYAVAGNIVVVSFDLRLSAKGSSTGVATIAGLPFAAGVGLPDAIGSIAWYDMNTTMVNLFPIVQGGTATISLLYYPSAATGYSSLTDTSFANASIIQGTLIYQQ